MPIGTLQPDRWEGERGGSPLCICNRIQVLLLPKAEQGLKAAASGIAPVWNGRGARPVPAKTEEEGFPRLSQGPCQPRAAFRPVAGGGKALDVLPTGSQSRGRR